MAVKLQRNFVFNMKAIVKEKLKEQIAKLTGDIAATKGRVAELYREIRGFDGCILGIEFDDYRELGLVVGVDCTSAVTSAARYEMLMKEEKRLEGKVLSDKKKLYYLKKLLRGVSNDY